MSKIIEDTKHAPSLSKMLARLQYEGEGCLIGAQLAGCRIISHHMGYVTYYGTLDVDNHHIIL